MRPLLMNVVFYWRSLCHFHCFRSGVRGITPPRARNLALDRISPPQLTLLRFLNIQDSERPRRAALWISNNVWPHYSLVPTVFNWEFKFPLTYGGLLIMHRLLFIASRIRCTSTVQSRRFELDRSWLIRIVEAFVTFGTFDVELY